MLRLNRFLKIVLAFVGALGLSMVFSQCTARSTPLPVEVVAGSATTTRTPRATQTAPVIRPIFSATPEPVRATATSSATPAQFPVLPTGIPILTADGSRAATSLQASAECDPDEPWKGIATLNWTVARNPGSEQRVAVTIYRDGFEKGKFDVSEPLPSDHSLLVWDRLSPGIIHFWMVLTRQVDGWVPSEQSSFEGPICAVDYVPSPTP
jgi:hypothetical protein